jgi:4-hydroxythreonine-4-phosphate dehydrogenase
MNARIGILLGDPNGIGPELAAKVLADGEMRAIADIVVIGDRRILDMGAKVAGVDVAFGDGIELVDQDTMPPDTVTRGEATAAGGRSVYLAIRQALAMARDGKIDGFCFAPMNKKALKLGGSPFPDEHILFAHELGFDGPFCEHNVLGDLWTVRVSSHIPLAEAAARVTEERIMEIAGLADRTLRGAGIAAPRVGICALNPHGGDGGMFGREEIDIIAPAVAKIRASGINAEGPYPADTIFVKARDGAFDVVVTMYHDQGQIAMKLMGFNKGVTVSGGLPVAIATPASGTAFDIVGKGIADPEGLRQAFLLTCRMAATRKQAAT